ncbi:MAG: FG-GAP-like repeat-containing protein [Desulfomicrobium escambiense]|nr:FG-GAP-like repeat-containing protein [Desulfomicrobium escambiense]
MGDLDGNGDLEIVVGRAAGSGTNTWVLEHTGDVRQGWPRLKAGDESSAWGVYNANIGLGDLDGDGLPEIIAPSDTITVSAYKPDGTQLFTNSMYHSQPRTRYEFLG